MGQEGDQNFEVFRNERWQPHALPAVVQASNLTGELGAHHSCLLSDHERRVFCCKLDWLSCLPCSPWPSSPRAAISWHSALWGGSPWWGIPQGRCLLPLALGESLGQPLHPTQGPTESEHTPLSSGTSGGDPRAPPGRAHRGQGPWRPLCCRVSRNPAGSECGKRGLPFLPVRKTRLIEGRPQLGWESSTDKS